MDPKLLNQLEQQYGFTPGLLNAVMQQESGGNPNAVSPKGARGWFQFMPDTAEEWGVDDPTDFNQSAKGAAAYLANLKKQFGNEEDALAAYNWGQGNLRKYKAGKVKAMPNETQNYVKSITARLGTDIPDIPDEVDIPELPDEPTAPKQEAPKVDWQKELENAKLTTILPTVGGIAGSVMGGIAGTGVAPVGGTIGGAGIGGLGGAMLGHATAIASHPAPVEEKLKYLAKQAGWESFFSAVGMKGANVVASVLAKTPADRLAVEQWFRTHGSTVRPLLSEKLSPRAHQNYKAAEKEMNVVIDNALDEVLNKLNRGNSPTDAGTVYQAAYKTARDTMNKEHDRLFTPFMHDEVYGKVMVKPTPEAIAIAKKALRYMADAKTSNKSASVGPDIKGILEDVAAGKSVPLPTLHTQKRVLADSANWEAYGSTVDNHIRKTLSTSLDTSIEAGLPAGPRGEYQRANQIAYNNLDIMNQQFIRKLATQPETDPMFVADFVAKNATPTTINEFKKSMGFMVRNGALKSNQAGMMMDHVRRNWVEQNMNSHSKAANMYEALLGKGADAEALDAFNAVFQGSPVRQTLLSAAKASHAVQQFAERIPAAKSVGAGGYITAGSLSALPGTMAGSPGLATAMSTVAVTSMFLTNWVPKLIANQRLAVDGALRNKVHLVSSWLQRATPEQMQEYLKIGAAAMPPGVARAYKDVAAEAENE
jgi:hypothetical protein